MMEGYDVAQVCLNGHPTNSSFTQLPQHSVEFCSACGASTITQCLQCEAQIRGYYWGSGVIGGPAYRPPRFCHKCGSAYPWTQAKKDAARELVDELDELSHEEREALKGSFDDLMSSTPKTEVAVTRTKKLIAKLGPAVGETIKKIVVEIGSEAAKKGMGL
jgi:hypothetical protein